MRFYRHWIACLLWVLVSERSRWVVFGRQAWFGNGALTLVSCLVSPAHDEWYALLDRIQPMETRFVDDFSLSPVFWPFCWQYWFTSLSMVLVEFSIQLAYQRVVRVKLEAMCTWSNHLAATCWFQQFSFHVAQDISGTQTLHKWRNVLINSSVFSTLIGPAHPNDTF